jgi:hypothetical protein
VQALGSVIDQHIRVTAFADGLSHQLHRLSGGILNAVGVR